MKTVKLYLGDCLEILPTLEDASVDAVITDIPYGTTACKWDEVIPFDEMWEQVKRVTGVFITTASQPFTSKLVMSNLDWFKYCWYWEKPRGANFTSIKWQPLKVVEEVCVFARYATVYTASNNNIVFNPQLEIREKPIKKSYSKSNINKSGTSFLRSNKLTGEIEYKNKHPRNLFYYSQDGDGRVHRTQKPVALYEYLIKTYTNEGETVLDFCMGSGTTGVACVQTGRNFIGIEIEPKYFEIAEARIAEAQLQMRMEI